MITISLQWRNKERDGVSKYWRLDCFLNRLFRHRSKKKSKLRVSVLCEGNSPVTDEFPARMASNAENASIWWRHNVNRLLSTDACSIKCVFNLLLPHDAMWRHRCGSKLAQVMSCYLRAPTITWISVDLSVMSSSDSHMRAISQQIPQSLKSAWITCLLFHSYLPGDNELNENKIASSKRKLGCASAMLLL